MEGDGRSVAERVAAMPEGQRASVLAGLSTETLASWAFWGRPEQQVPGGDWLVWLILAGRGWGKTRTGAETAALWARLIPRARIALVAPTLSDVRDVMVEGESGLLSVLSPSEFRGGDVDRAWNRSLGELTLANGSRFKGYSSERPRKLRGPQHHAAWCDEASSWTDAGKGPGEDTTWSNLLLGLRLGRVPRIVVTTTPKRNALTRALASGAPSGPAGHLPRGAGEGSRPGGVVVTRGTTYDNLANLAPTFREAVLSRYEGTTLGRQELLADLLGDVEGALWTAALIERQRAPSAPSGHLPHAWGRDTFSRVVVAVDPTVSSVGADECGIVVCGEVGPLRPSGTSPADGGGRPRVGDAVVVEDATLRASPPVWASRVADAVARWKADAVVAEGNQGGALVEATLRAAGVTVPVRTVYAHRGKDARAEPVVTHYEAGRVWHAGVFAALEDQMTGWVPGTGRSPDRVDALVWAITDLLVDGAGDVEVALW